MDNNYEKYLKMRDDIDEYIRLRNIGKKIREEKEKKEEIIYQDCCICYDEENTFIIKTKCNHFLCMQCLYKLKKYECPMCREVFPDDIKNLLPNTNVLNNANYGILNSSFSWGGTPMTLNNYN